MKIHPSFLLLSLLPLQAQEPVRPPVVVEETTIPAPPVVVEERATVVPVADPFDPVAVRRQLAIVPSPAVPGTIETTETRKIVREPGQPARVYNIERHVVIVDGREMPYVTLPVLFEKETANLLDSSSAEALDQTAKAILEVLATNPDAGFDIEGHTSTDGTDEFNLKLSADRAKRIYDELTVKYGVPTRALGAHGFGEKYPSHPDGTEAEMELDRRVLVVRVK
ncbi:OmpA family protein [Luteolibacter marinus]|uniref:OmpA family protein n=1 Tax=Luteolibacter marinus TaxID=2776705 RepID=UPI001865D057|nr:OmpA family protein [Luteolibacter marinus]